MGLLTAIGPLSIDMYLPAFPPIAKSLHSSVSAVTLSLSSFFVGISGGQLLNGPLLEGYGRKTSCTLVFPFTSWLLWGVHHVPARIYGHCLFFIHFLVLIVTNRLQPYYILVAFVIADSNMYHPAFR